MWQDQLKQIRSFSNTPGNKHIEKEVMELLQFTIILKKVKYLGINRTKKVKNSTMKASSKESDKVTFKWKDIL